MGSEADTDTNDDDTGADSDSTGGSGQGGSDGSGTDRKLDVAEVQRIATKENRAGAAKARRDLAEQLGVSLDEAAEIIKAHKARTEAEKDEITKAREAATAAAAERDQVAAALKREQLRGRLSTALLAADGDNPGCDPSAVGTVTELALGFAADVPDGESDPVAWAVAETRKSLPHVFVGAGGTDADDQGSAGRRTPPGRPHGQNRGRPPQQKSVKDRAREYLDSGGTGGPGNEGRPLWAPRAD